MVLILSLWDDHAAHMLWLDSNYPADGDASVPGIARGPCPTDSGNPPDVENEQADATVKDSSNQSSVIQSGVTYVAFSKRRKRVNI